MSKQKIKGNFYNSLLFASNKERKGEVHLKRVLNAKKTKYRESCYMIKLFNKYCL